MTAPAIHTLVVRAVIGELGDGTVVRHDPICPACSRRETRVESIEYVFDRWSGEDLVTAMGEYAASDRLRLEIERRHLSGCHFLPMKVSRAPGFKITGKPYASALPGFQRLIVTGSAEGPEIWATKKTCPTCGIVYFRLTADGLKAAALSAAADAPRPRQVYEDTWKSDDIFHLPDRLRPVITQRFADLLVELRVKDVVTLPAEWVGR